MEPEALYSIGFRVDHDTVIAIIIRGTTQDINTGVFGGADAAKSVAISLSALYRHVVRIGEVQAVAAVGIIQRTTRNIHFGNPPQVDIVEILGPAPVVVD